MLKSIGFATVLFGFLIPTGRNVSGRQGMQWGLVAFVCFHLAPSLGLLPVCWMGVLVATAVGVWLVGGRTWMHRIAGVVSVAIPHVIGAPVAVPSELSNVVGLCLRGPGYSVSQELAAIWISEGIDSVVFPSATGAGRNVAVHLANAAAGSVVVRNRCRSPDGLRRPRMGRRGR